MSTRNKPRSAGHTQRTPWYVPVVLVIIFALPGVFLIAPMILRTISLGDQPSGTRESVIVAQNNPLPSIAYSLAGKDVNIFGDDQYLDEERTNVTSQGAYPMERGDWRSALALSGTEWLELHCFDDNQDNEIVILARNARLVEQWSVMPTISCAKGWILPGFRSPGSPDITLQ